MRYTGRCHCANLRFVLDWPDAPERLPARACGCDFCRQHGGLWTASPAAELAVQVDDPGLLRPYRFGTCTADFHVCARCGVVPLVTSEIGGRTYAVVSVNALDGLDPARIDRTPVSFDGETESDRLARRARGWIARVRWPAEGLAPDAPDAASPRLSGSTPRPRTDRA